MIHKRAAFIMGICISVVSSSLHAAADSSAHARETENPTPLDAYVARPDPHYSVDLAATLPGKGFTVYVLDLTSQSWLTNEQVDRTVWKHWLTLVQPDRVQGDTGMLFISGGSNRDEPPGKLDERLAKIAMETRSVVAGLGQVPNQPLTFTGDPGNPRVEDALIAYTWDKFLRTGDAEWLARLPMTKSAVKAMDAITEFLAGKDDNPVDVRNFVVAGGSKRGWTTWTTAAVDKRVKAIAPIVIDMLNLAPSFDHHYRAYGFFAPAVNDYEEMGIMDWLGRPEIKKLNAIVEPYEYRDRLTMPKFLLNASGDQFFLPDSWKFYLRELKGETHVRYVENTGHSMSDSDALESLVAFYQAILTDTPRPEYDWTLTSDGAFEVRAKTKPLEVKLWQAHNPDARDFRRDVLGEVWKSSKVKPDEEGVYIGKPETPEKGYRAYFLEMTFKGPGRIPFKFTTGTHVLPDKLPFDAYDPKPVN